MSARIYSPAKNAMQSGKAKTGHWVLEFDPEQRRKIDPLMGYTTSGDMKSQIRLTFETLEDIVLRRPSTSSKVHFPLRHQQEQDQGGAIGSRLPGNLAHPTLTFVFATTGTRSSGVRMPL